MDLSQTESMIARHEGLKLKPYQCTADKLTIGYGRNLDDNGISMDEAKIMLANDVQTSYEQLRGFMWFEGVNEYRKMVLVDMCFNLGLPRLQGFKNMLSAVMQGNYDKAAAEMLDSKWANQVGQRALTLSRIMKNGHL